MSTYYTQGIIIRHQDLREADRLVTIFSREFGLIKAQAKSSRKTGSKLGGNLEPFIQATFYLVHGRRFETVAHVDVIRNYRRIKETLEKVGIAGRVAHLVDQMAVGHQHDARLYVLLEEALNTLEYRRLTVVQARILLWSFIWRSLAILGFMPELYQCVVCRKKITARPCFFSFRKGGCVNDLCRQQARDGVPISINAIKVLRLLAEKTVAEALRLTMTPALMREVEALTGAYLNYSQERDFNRINFH